MCREWVSQYGRVLVFYSRVERGALVRSEAEQIYPLLLEKWLAQPAGEVEILAEPGIPEMLPDLVLEYLASKLYHAVRVVFG